MSRFIQPVRLITCAILTGLLILFLSFSIIHIKLWIIEKEYKMEALSFSVRYIVNDVPAAINFYSKLLGFKVEMNPNDQFAILSRDGLRLMLNTPYGPGGGSQPMRDNSRPRPGGWNRIQIQVDNIEKVIDELRKSNVQFRSDLITGIGAKQVIIDDPSGNPIEINELLPQ